MHILVIKPFRLVKYFPSYNQFCIFSVQNCVFARSGVPLFLALRFLKFFAKIKVYHSPTYLGKINSLGATVAEIYVFEINEVEIHHGGPFFKNFQVCSVGEYVDFLFPKNFPRTLFKKLRFDCSDSVQVKFDT